MYTTNSVNQALFLPNELPSGNFVGIIATVNNDKEVNHSGLMISFSNQFYILHYNAKVVELTSNSDAKAFQVIVKFIDNIEVDLVEAFLAHCKQVRKNAAPKYGYFYGGSIYNANGDFISKLGMKEYMTCVGFCINVVQGFLGEKYILYEDWDETTKVDASEYFAKFLKKENSMGEVIDESLYRKNLRRITPIEYTTSGFHNKLPITRADIETNLDLVSRCLIEKWTKAYTS